MFLEGKGCITVRGAFRWIHLNLSIVRVYLQKPPPKKNLDKATRLPRNELLDLLFSLFDKHEYWRLKGLREKTLQPEIYLKEVMGDIAVAVRSGPYTGYWTLMDVYKQAGKERQKKEEEARVKAEAEKEDTVDLGRAGSGSGQAEEDEGYGSPVDSASASDEEDEEDMEEV